MHIVTKGEVLKNSTSFADCLKYMIAAKRAGNTLDLSRWRADMQSLLNLDSRKLDFLLLMFRDFHSAICRRGMRKSDLANQKNQKVKE